MQLSGFTQIPNDILEKIISLTLTGAAFKCVFFLIRKTLGYGKQVDKLSHSQIAKATNLNPRSVKRGMAELSKLNIAILVKRGSKWTSCNEWKLNVDISSWVSVEHKSPVSEAIPVPEVSLVTEMSPVTENADTSDKNGQALVSEMSPTIESNTKENLQKKDTNVSASQGEVRKEFGNKEINEMLLALKAEIGIQAFVDSAIERKIAPHCVSLMKKIGPEEFVRRLRLLLSEPFSQKNCNKIKYVYNNIKGFIEPKSKKSSLAFIS